MSVTKLTKKEHGYQGYRVLVQIGNTMHRKYFSTAGLPPAEAKAVLQEAKALNARLNLKKSEHKKKVIQTSHYRAHPRTDLGLTGLQRGYSARHGIASPYFRIFLYARDRKPKFKTYAILTRGLADAWELAINQWARVYGIDDADKEKALKRNKPTKRHFEALGERIFAAGHDINIDHLD